MAGLILVASVVQSPGHGVDFEPLGFVGLDKWMHAVAYAALSGTVASLLARRRHGLATVVAGAVAASFAYGATIELLQLSVPTRQFGVGDLGANAVGVTLGVALWCIVRRRRATDA